MRASDHPESLSDFVNGLLDEMKNKEVMEHLSECDDCLHKVDRLWSGTAASPATFRVPTLDPGTDVRMRGRMMRRIRRSNFAGTIVRFATKGFVSVIVTFLQPLLPVRERTRPQDGESKR